MMFPKVACLFMANGINRLKLQWDTDAALGGWLVPAVTGPFEIMSRTKSR